jgi:hypothetical protein
LVSIREKSHLLENHNFGNFILAYFTALPKAAVESGRGGKSNVTEFGHRENSEAHCKAVQRKKNCKKNISLLLVQI